MRIKCSAEVYEGSEAYIFISYSHQDQELVYPYIERLNRDGYRIWYDEGITPGDEWPENIAMHLERCSVFIAFITEASANSHNCRNEINYAVQREKSFVSLFLDDAALSRGMELILSSVQGIYRSKYDSDEAFIRKLYETEALNQCKGQPARTFSAIEDFDDDETVTLTQGIPGFSAGDLETYLLRVRTQEKIHIRKNEFTLGRSKAQADYVITGEYSISRRHATVRKIRNSYTITDNDSLNHVGLNGRLIAPGTEYDIGAYDIVSLAKEHLVFFKNYNESARKQTPGYVLRSGGKSWSIGDRAVTRIGSQPLEEDGSGNEVWIADPGVAAQQALLIAASDGMYLVDISENRSTRINDRPLSFCTRIRLQPGDRITVGSQVLEIERKL
ncbi:MAG: TIR domain-containing protein [Firmicutes bacterium]|nr:TIR domain-containing protein [Bacillota bacterium]